MNDIDLFLEENAERAGHPERYYRHAVMALADGYNIDDALYIADKLDEPRRETPARYDKGWEPGPNAEWKRKTPNELASSLKSKESTPKAEPNPKLNELVSNKQPEHKATLAEIKAEKKALPAPDDLANAIREKKTPVSPEEGRKILQDAITDGRVEQWVNEAIKRQTSKGNKDPHQVRATAEDAIMRAAAGLKKGEEGKFDNFARSAIKNALISEGRRTNSLKEGAGKVKQIPADYDTAGMTSDTGIDPLDFKQLMSELTPEQKAVAEHFLANPEMGGRERAAELGMNPSKAHNLLKSLAPIFDRLNYSKIADKIRYHLEADKDFYEYGPRHQPPKRIEGAVARLEALRDFRDEIDEDKIADEIEDIAREFSAEELKDVARGLGIEKGLDSKYNVLRLLMEKVCGKGK